jgi:lysozyme
MTRTCGLAGLHLIEEFEGLFLTAYRDPIGILTIGWGHTGIDVQDGLTITKAEAESLLRGDIAEAENIVNRNCPNVGQNQFDALVSFVFNVGPGVEGVKDGFVTLRNGEPSTMLKLIRKNYFESAAEQFKYWNKAGGKMLPGLVRRRGAEAELFRTVDAA